MGPILPDKSNPLYHSLYKTGTENNGSETNYVAPPFDCKEI